MKILNTRVSDAFWVLLPGGGEIWNHENFFYRFLGMGGQSGAHVRRLEANIGDLSAAPPQAGFPSPKAPFKAKMIQQVRPQSALTAAGIGTDSTKMGHRGMLYRVVGPIRQECFRSAHFHISETAALRA